jgi:hypothetical protein
MNIPPINNAPPHRAGDPNMPGWCWDANRGQWITIEQRDAEATQAIKDYRQGRRIMYLIVFVVIAIAIFATTTPQDWGCGIGLR